MWQTYYEILSLCINMWRLNISWFHNMVTNVARSCYNTESSVHDILYFIAARVCPHHVLSSLWGLYLPQLLLRHNLACWPTRLLTWDPRIWTFNPQAEATYSGRSISLELLATSDFVYVSQFLPDTHLVYIVIDFCLYTVSKNTQSFTAAFSFRSLCFFSTYEGSTGLETFF